MIAERRPALCIGLFTCCLIFWCWQTSRFAPLWLDEIFTFHIAQSADWWAAAQRFDQPPLHYLLTRWSQAALGTGEFGTRFPSVAGLGLASAALFLIARRRCGGASALVALCFPAATAALLYANDSRPYALLLGLAAASVYCWHLAATDRRVAGLCGLALCINAALWTHYYAPVQVVLPIAVGEAVRSWQRRRVDWGIVAALATGFVSLAMLLPMALNGARPLAAYVLHSPVFWAKPALQDVVEFFPALLTRSLLPLLVGLAFWRPDKQAGRQTGGLTVPEAACALAFVLMPVYLVLFTKFFTGYFMDRYAVTALVGAVMLVSQVTRERMAMIMVPLLLGIPFSQAVLRSPNPVATYLPQGDLPIVVANAAAFVAAAHYQVSPRLVYLTDKAYAVQQADFLPELSLLRDPGLVPGHVEDYWVFTSGHSEFWAVADGVPRLEWTIPRLAADGFQVTLHRQEKGRTWYRVLRQQ